MAAEAKAGRTPPALEAFLRATFPPPRQPWAWVRSALLGPRTYRVHQLVPFDDGRFFSRSCVFWMYADRDLLDSHVLPSGGSYGVCALGPSGVRYLVHRKPNVIALLRAEDRALDECRPAVLASLIVATLGVERNASHDVLRSLDHLLDYRMGAERYVLDERELGRVRSEIVPPTISGDRTSGWTLTFCSLFGWMHDKGRLVRHRVRFGPDFGLDRHETVLSNAIFKEVPMVIY